MRLDQDGSPIITGYDETKRAERFVDKVVERIWDRLPRLVRVFLSKDSLAQKLRAVILELAAE